MHVARHRVDRAGAQQHRIRVFFQGQNGPFVFQKHHTGLGDFQRLPAVFVQDLVAAALVHDLVHLDGLRRIGVRCGGAVPADLHQPQVADPAHGVEVVAHGLVDVRLGQGAGLQSLLDGLQIVEAVGGGLHGDALVHGELIVSAPVRQDNALPVPLIAEHFLQHIAVGAGLLAVGAAVVGHDGVGGVVPPEDLLIDGELIFHHGLLVGIAHAAHVLQASEHVVFLQPLGHGAAQLSLQIPVLAEHIPGTARSERTHQVRLDAQLHIAGAGLVVPGIQGAVALRQVPVEGAGQGDLAGGPGGFKAGVADDAHGPVVAPHHRHAHPGRALPVAGAVALVDGHGGGVLAHDAVCGEHLDLLLQGQGFQDRLDLLPEHGVRGIGLDMGDGVRLRKLRREITVAVVVDLVFLAHRLPPWIMGGQTVLPAHEVPVCRSLKWYYLF